MNAEFENADGGVIDYEAVTSAIQNTGNNFRENGLPIEDMSFADGDDEFYDADGDDEFYNAGGLARWRERRQEKHEAKMAKKGAKTDIKKARAEKKIATGEAKKTKADAKVGLAEAQKLSAEASSKGTEADIAMANALKGDGAKSGMSTGAKIGIAVGVVLVLGVVGYIIYKKSKKGK